MKINFKQPKYVLPLIVLPFLCLFFYVWHSSASRKTAAVKAEAGIRDNIGDVSSDVKKKGLSDKLDAFRNTYKEADGYTAVNPISTEAGSGPAFTSRYSAGEQRRLDSIDQQMKQQFGGVTSSAAVRAGASYPVPGTARRSSDRSADDKALAAALAGLSAQRRGRPPAPSALPAASGGQDPMDLFKTQMAYMDSMSKANDPEYKAETARKQLVARTEALRQRQTVLEVRRSLDQPDDFNTIMAQNKENFITAVIDEEVTGYAGSRIRVRLLDDIYAGHVLIRKGTYLYALISGFQGQRVSLTVQSVLTAGTILPVKLEVYDQDGLPGLYVPASAFRDFTKDLSGNSLQGVTIDGGAQNGSQFLMSTLDKVFQSTSSAIASAIRKNKAKIKYNSYIFLIDPQAQQNALQNH